MIWKWNIAGGHVKKFIFCAVIAPVIVVAAWSQEGEPCIGVPGAIVLNYLPGFGLGSFIQGDTCGGTIQLVTEVVGIGCALIAMEVVSRTMTPEEKPSYMMPAFVVGILPAAAGMVFGLIRPIWYCFKHRQEHEDSTLSVRIAPGIAQSVDRQGFDVGARLVITVPIG